MAINPVNILFKTLFDGKGAKQAQDAIDGTGKAAGNAAPKLTTLQAAGLTAGAALAALATANQIFQAGMQGAALEKQAEIFERLAASMGTTADVMLGKLREATRGMMSDAMLMESASSIISLGLGKTEEDVIRLATVIGGLGLDMQQVILTFANDSKMRLDALGLSVEGVDQRVEELKAQNFEGDVFDQAVLLELEDRYKMLADGVGESDQEFKTFIANMENAKNGALRMVADGLTPAIATFNDLTEAVGNADDASIPLGTRLGNMSLAIYEATGSTAALTTGLFLLEGGMRELADNGIAGMTSAAFYAIDPFEGMVTVVEDAETAARNAALAAQEYSTALGESRGPNEELNDKILQRAGLLSAEEAAIATANTAIRARRDAQVAAAEADRQAAEAAEAVRVAVQEFAAVLQSDSEPLVEYVGLIANSEAAHDDVTAALVRLQEEYRNTAVERALSQAETLEEIDTALRLAVALGTMTQAQADARLEYARDQEAIAIVTQALQNQTISVDAAAIAIGILGESEGVTAQQAIQMATDMDHAATRADVLATKAGNAAQNYVLDYLDNAEEAITNANRVRDAANAAAGDRSIRFNISTSGTIPGGGPAGGGGPIAYATGGYTGSGNWREIAGVVHRDELVIPSAVRRAGPDAAADFIARNDPLLGGNTQQGARQNVTINVTDNKQAAIVAHAFTRQQRDARWGRI